MEDRAVAILVTVFLSFTGALVALQVMESQMIRLHFKQHSMLWPTPMG